MLTKEDIKLLSDLMDKKLDEKLKPINERLDKVDERFDKMDERFDKMDERLDNIEEETKIARYVSEELMKWVELNFSHKYPFPIDKDIDVG